MTNKQIIIDDVDVGGCEWIREVGLDSEYICTCNSPNKTSGYCKDNPNCCYKQLKRKEKECEELKATLKVIAGRPCLNPNDCNGHCLPNCKWNAHKLAQKALGNDF